MNRPLLSAIGATVLAGTATLAFAAFDRSAQPASSSSPAATG